MKGESKLKYPNLITTCKKKKLTSLAFINHIFFITYSLQF